MRRPQQDVDSDLEILVQLLKRPKTRLFIARKFGIHLVTVSKWMKKLEDQGHVIRRINRGLPAKYQIMA